MMKQASYMDFKKLFAQAEKRVHGAMQHVVAEYAQDYKEAVRDSAPSEEQIPGYKSAIIATSIDGTTDSAVIVEDMRRVETVADQDEEFIVLDVKPIGKPSPKFVIIKKYAPYVKKYFPIPSAQADFTIEYRKVRAGEVRSTEELNRSREGQVTFELGKLGIKTGPLNSAAEVKEDLAFKILRAEAGLLPKISPHWRPALISTKSKTETSVNFADLISNPDSDEYKQNKRNDASISADEAAAVQKFQDKIS